MYGLKDVDGVIVDVSDTTPSISADGILFNNCLYPQVAVLSVVENIPNYVKPRRFKLEGIGVLPLMVEMNEYENLLIEEGRKEIRGKVTEAVPKINELGIAELKNKGVLPQ